MSARLFARQAGFAVLVLASACACVRIYDDAKADAGRDATAVVGGVCDTKYGGYPFAVTLGSNVVDALLTDCRLKAYFSALPPDRLPHLRECFALQLGSILQCTRDGARVKYPALDSKGVLCRDMKSSHAGNGLTQGDFSAFIAVVDGVLDDAKVEEDDVKTVLGTFGNPTTKKDIVESQSTALSKPGADCDAGTPPSDGGGDTSDPYGY
jgi:hypothetical protein